MSQTFAPDGGLETIVLIFAEPNHITIRRNERKDGYEAVQLALPKKNAKVELIEKKRTPESMKKVFAKRAEFKGSVEEDVSELTVAQFAPGDVVEVVGTSKGKGYAGVVKRHHFAGGPASHGHRHVLRRPGSIGSRFPQHVRKGKRMAGRMGTDRVTVKNLVIVSVDAVKNTIAVKGAVPGPRGSVVEIRSVENTK